MQRKQRIENILKTALSPQKLVLTDESEKHRNHLPEHQGDETHLALTICAKQLDSLSKVEQHRLLYKLLETEFQKRLHSLQIKVIPNSK